MAAPTRDLILAADAGRSDVRSIEGTGALVNDVRLGGVVAKASAEEQAKLHGMEYSVTILTPGITDVCDVDFRTPADDGRHLTYAQFRDTMATIAANNPRIHDAAGWLVSSFDVHHSSFIVPAAMPAGVYFATPNTGNAAPAQFVVTR